MIDAILSLFHAERFLISGLAILLSFVFALSSKRLTPTVWCFIIIPYNGLFMRLNRPHRPAGDLIFRGFIVLSFMVIISGTVGLIVQSFIQSLPFSWGIHAFILGLCLSAGAITLHSIRFTRTIEGERASKGAYQSLALATGRDLNGLDDPAMRRISIALYAYLLTSGIILPPLFYIALGLPGAFIVATVSALTHHALKNDGEPSHFTSPFFAADAAVNAITNLISASYCILAAILTPKASFTRPFFLSNKNAPPARLTYGGITVTYISRILNCTLSSPFQSHKKLAWVGPKNASAKITATHSRMMMILISYFNVLVVLTLFGLFALLY